MATKLKIGTIVLCVILVIFPKAAAAQFEVSPSQPALNSLYAELFGPYYFFTVNYDRILDYFWEEYSGRLFRSHSPASLFNVQACDFQK